MSEEPGCYDRFQIKGEWWIPERPDHRLRGTLDHAPERRTLTVDGSLSGAGGTLPEMRRSGKVTRHPVIYGRRDDGEPVTIHDGCLTGARATMSGTTSESFLLTDVFVGCHLGGSDGLEFECVRVGTTYLDAWLGVSGFGSGSQGDPEGSGIVISYSNPESMRHKIDGGLEISMEFRYSVEIEMFPTQKRNIVQRSLVAIRPDAAMPFWRLVEHVRDLNNFLSLITLVPSYATRVSGDAVSAGGGSRGQERSVQIYSGRIATHALPEYQAPVLPTLPYGAIRDRFGSLYGKWLGNKEDLDPVYGLYSGVIYDSGMRLDAQLLNLSFAAESFHRNTVCNEVIPRGEHRMRMKEIKGHAPDHWEWLAGQLSHSNEPSLSKRLTYLAGRYKYAVGDIDAGKFVGDLVKTRNYYTHYDKGLKHEVPSIERQAYLASVMTVMVGAFLMDSAGFKRDEILKVALESRRRRVGQYDGRVPPPI